jgi:SMI1 / KNR4 family (SUKH-1)
MFHPATPEQVAGFEKREGIVLPADYRRFLTSSAAHPGDLGPQESVLISVGVCCPLECGIFSEFYCFEPVHRYLELVGVPFLDSFEGGLAIARDDDGVPWIMSLLEPDYGWVYFCHQIVTRNELNLVAKSFTEFLALVEPEDLDVCKVLYPVFEKGQGSAPLSLDGLGVLPPPLSGCD